MEIIITINYEMPKDFSKVSPLIAKSVDDFKAVLSTLCKFYGIGFKEELIDSGDPDDVGAIPYREQIFTISIRNQSIATTLGFAEVVTGLSKIYRPYFQLLDISCTPTPKLKG